MGKLKNQSLGIDYVDGEVIYFKEHKVGQNDSFPRGQQLWMDTHEDGSPVPLGHNFEAHVLLPDSNRVYPLHFSKCILAGGGETGNLGRLAGIGLGKGVLSVEIPTERKRDYVFRVQASE